MSILEGAADGVGFQQMVLQKGGGRESKHDDPSMDLPRLSQQLPAPANFQVFAELPIMAYARSYRWGSGG